MEVCRGKTVFLGVSEVTLEFFWSGWRVLAQNTRALVKFGDFQGFLFIFWSV
jgi:hypothetical protein